MLSSFSEIRALFLKEVLVELRRKYAISGIILYIVSAVFIINITWGVSNQTITSEIWNALFWIVMLFSSINGASKAFLLESEGLQLYYYSIASPQNIIAAKIIYNLSLNLILGTLGLIFFILIMGNPIINIPLFAIVLFLASLGFSIILTFISAIASKTRSGNILMAILSFPIIIPMLMQIIKISSNAMNGFVIAQSLKEIGLIISINLIVGAVAFLLFPFIWRS